MAHSGSSMPSADTHSPEEGSKISYRHGVVRRPPHQSAGEQRSTVGQSDAHRAVSFDFGGSDGRPHIRRRVVDFRHPESSSRPPRSSSAAFVTRAPPVTSTLPSASGKEPGHTRGTLISAAADQTPDPGRRSRPCRGNPSRAHSYRIEPCRRLQAPYRLRAPPQYGVPLPRPSRRGLRRRLGRSALRRRSARPSPPRQRQLQRRRCSFDTPRGPPRLRPCRPLRRLRARRVSPHRTATASTPRPPADPVPSAPAPAGPCPRSASRSHGYARGGSILSRPDGRSDHRKTARTYTASPTNAPLKRSPNWSQSRNTSPTRRPKDHSFRRDHWLRCPISTMAICRPLGHLLFGFPVWSRCLSCRSPSCHPESRQTRSSARPATRICSRVG